MEHNTVDFTNIFNLIEEWCELNGITSEEFIDMYGWCVEEEYFEEIDE